MLDIKFVRNNPDVVKQNIKNKFQDEKLPLVDEVIELDQKNRDIKGEYNGTASNEGYKLEDGTELNLSDKDKLWVGLRDTFKF